LFEKNPVSIASHEGFIFPELHKEAQRQDFRMKPVSENLFKGKDKHNRQTTPLDIKICIQLQYFLFIS
jgi:hypothetical protein